MIKRKSWQDYQKEIADDHYYYARSCIRQNFFPGSEKLFIDMLRNDLGGILRMTRSTRRARESVTIRISCRSKPS